MSGTTPKKIGKYVIGELIGKGRCGKVYLAFDPFIQREVAVKVAEKNKNADVDFFTEAYVAGKLQHPHIVGLYDAGEENNLQYLVMEMVYGGTLRNYGFYKEKQLGDERIIDIIHKCCMALDYSHKEGVIHRDIKPSNIMLSKKGTVKIMDFGIAILSDVNEITKNGLAVGSPIYMSPEQVRNKGIDARSDLYSIAVVMFELLTKKLLFKADDMQKLFKKILHEDAPRLSTFRPDLPKELDSILVKALSKDKNHRYKSGKEMALALSKIFDVLRLSGKKISKNESRDIDSRNMLSNLNFFNGFRDFEISELLELSKILTFKQGGEIFSESDKKDCFYIIIRGTVEVVKSSITIETLSTGDCFGEIGFLLKQKRTASIKALSDVKVLQVQESLMDNASLETQLRYYKAFSEIIIYRLIVTSARLAAIKITS
jgi:serine/threonine-protein kinase